MTSEFPKSAETYLERLLDRHDTLAKQKKGTEQIKSDISSHYKEMKAGKSAKPALWSK